ncbi:uncharacterized protein B0I36DRAFT_22653 [Microdochium trichocladiopsis]|uniref:Fucose-specific lectin n=1 Tax=Microdochium trichocladiopsis TaxID=1682393 RepID=A0A9P8YKV4_9PEZI|nr:uncharacterized protein B0I36DRAFT_22653 [Microdochium trichocladiopsis]KAH7041371.1 hypothetical protein B0I36DRAFT_22653 [Microdochium trichocladiopsis]
MAYQQHQQHQYGSPHTAYSATATPSPGAQTYSTLEHDSSVQNGQYPEVSAYSTLPEVDHSANPTAAQYAHYTHAATPEYSHPVATGGGGEVYKKEADGGAYAPGAAAAAAAGVGAGSAGAGGAELGAAAGPERRICGVRRKLFWILLAAAVVIVVAAVGGGVGGALGSRTSSSSGDPNAGANPVQPPEPTDAPLAVYPGTRLASSNFTDQYGNDNYMVIYQVNSGALYMSSWNTSVSKWVVSVVADGKTNAIKLDEIALGTTISLDTYFDTQSRIMHLYWLAPNGVLKSARHDELVTNDDAVKAASKWYKAPASDLYTAAPGSSIVSYGRECLDQSCPVWSYLIWQRADASLQSAGLDPGKQWAALGTAGQGIAKAADNTTMAMAIAMARPSGGNNTDTQFRSLSIFYREESGVLAQLIWDRRTPEGGWNGNNLPRGVGPRTAIAAFSTGNNDTDSSFLPLGFSVLTADPDADRDEVLLTYFKDGSWTSGAAVDSMADCAGPASMVANQGRRVYCVAKQGGGDGRKVEIRQFRWKGDPADTGSYRDYEMTTLNAGAA